MDHPNRKIPRLPKSTPAVNSASDIQLDEENKYLTKKITKWLTTISENTAIHNLVMSKIDTNEIKTSQSLVDGPKIEELISFYGSNSNRKMVLLVQQNVKMVELGSSGTWIL
jgi:hypothetical protein